MNPRSLPALRTARAFLVGVVLSTASIAAVQNPPGPQAEITDLAARIDPIFAAWDRPDSPGCAVGVVRDGRLVHARGYGMADLEHGIPITATTVFDIASTSKQFTAACIALLAQEGKLSLDDDLRTHVPEIPDYGKPIALRHLLHHTSGLRDYLLLFALAGIDTEDLTGEEEALAMIARQKGLCFAPGEKHSYSNSGYFLLSLVVKRAAGRTLADFAHQRIFAPLGMESSHFHDDHARIVPRRAVGYAPRAGGGFGIAMSDFEQTGDGGLMTTVEDLAKWDANFYAGKVGGQALSDLLHTRGRLNDGTLLDYALGLSLGDHAGLEWVAHGGGWAGYRAQMLRFPSEQLTVICLANLASVDPSAPCWRVAAVCLGEKLASREKPAARPAEPPPARAVPPALTPEKAAGYVGEYESEDLGVVYAIGLDGGRITIGARTERRVPLEPISEDLFEVGGALLEFRRGEAGKVEGFEIEAGEVRDIRCLRRPLRASERK